MWWGEGEESHYKKDAALQVKSRWPSGRPKRQWRIGSSLRQKELSKETQEIGICGNRRFETVTPELGKAEEEEEYLNDG